MAHVVSGCAAGRLAALPLRLPTRGVRQGMAEGVAVNPTPTATRPARTAQPQLLTSAALATLPGDRVSQQFEDIFRLQA